jgi:hypothetical protein
LTGGIPIVIAVDIREPSQNEMIPRVTVNGFEDISRIYQGIE